MNSTKGFGKIFCAKFLQAFGLTGGQFLQAFGLKGAKFLQGFGLRRNRNRVGLLLLRRILKSGFTHRIVANENRSQLVENCN